MSSFDFANLFILDLANNHQGDLAHGTRIISEASRVVREANVRAAVKFQFRDLDSFIHPDHQTGSSAPHIPRFLGTRLSTNDYKRLFQVVKENGGGLASYCRNSCLLDFARGVPQCKAIGVRKEEGSGPCPSAASIGERLHPYSGAPLHE